MVVEFRQTFGDLGDDRRSGWVKHWRRLGRVRVRAGGY
jgi:hypothetical protein